MNLNDLISHVFVHARSLIQLLKDMQSNTQDVPRCDRDVMSKEVDIEEFISDRSGNLESAPHELPLSLAALNETGVRVEFRRLLRASLRNTALTPVSVKMRSRALCRRTSELS